MFICNLIAYKHPLSVALFDLFKMSSSDSDSAPPALSKISTLVNECTQEQFEAMAKKLSSLHRHRDNETGDNAQRVETPYKKLSWNDCVKFMHIICTIADILFAVFSTWGPYIIWRYSNDALTIAITNSVWLECNIISELHYVLTTSIEKQADSPTAVRVLYGWDLLISTGILTPAIIYSWLYYAIPQASYNTLVGTLLLAYGIIELCISIWTRVVQYCT